MGLGLAPGASELENPRRMNEGEDLIRVVIADDDADIRALLAAIVEREPSMELAGTAADTDEAVRVTTEAEPNVVILDWMMPGGGGSKAAADISAQLPSTRIVGITAGDATMASYDMGTHGAVAFLQKGFSSDELIETIRSAMRW
jgi:DNA-binding NarL/FixJ family response regulator